MRGVFKNLSRGTALSALTVFMTLLTMTACEKTPTGTNDIRIWSTYNTVKVMADYGEYPDLGQRINVKMALGETEGAQLLLTPEKDVRDYTLTADNLTASDGTVYGKENIDIFIQRYINMAIKSADNTNLDYPVGHIPDMLLPQEVAVEFGENTASAGMNQGITVEFRTTKDTKPGIYSGAFELTADDVSYEIPVYLTIWDIDITESRGHSSFRASNEQFFHGELKNTPDLYIQNYDTILNKYRICYEDIPGSSDPVTMAQSVIEYWDNPHFTSYNIPTYANSSGVLDKRLFTPYLYELAIASEPGRILFDKAYVYPNFLDEPPDWKYPAVAETMEVVYEAEDELFDRLLNEGYFDRYDEKYKQEFYESLTHIPVTTAVASTHVIDNLGDGLNTYCAVLSQLDTEVYRDKYYSAADSNADRGGSVWYYTCVQPSHPYPSHHLDDYLLGSRVMKWMEKAYNLGGYLYWAINTYQKYDSALGSVYADPYEQGLRFGTGDYGINGDGFMVYPGKKYGLDEPIGSLRITTYRDGQEDLNMLYYLDDLYRAAERTYGLEEGTLDMNKALDNIYSSLFSGTHYTFDDSNFYKQREALVKFIEETKNETGLILDSSISNGRVTTDLYVGEEYSVTVNGAPLTGATASGNGKKFTLVKNLTEDVIYDIAVSKDGREVQRVNRFIAGKISRIEADAESDVFSVSDSGTMINKDGAIHATLVSKGSTVEEILEFKPGLMISAAAFEKPFTEIRNITFLLENPLDFDITVNVTLAAGWNEVNIKEGLVIPAHGSVLVECRNVFGTTFSALDRVDSLRIYLPNADGNGVLYPERQLILKDITYDFKVKD